MHVVEGDQNPIMVPYVGLQVGRHALLGRLLIVGADKVRIALPERELVRRRVGPPRVAGKWLAALMVPGGRPWLPTFFPTNGTR
jgi:hypothetical protein